MSLRQAAILLPAALLLAITYVMTRDFETVLEPVGFEQISGWEADDHGLSFAAFRRSCERIAAEDDYPSRQAVFGGQLAIWRNICLIAEESRSPRRFFEENFQPFLVHDGERPEGLFTGYYEPEAAGSLVATAEFRIPLFRKPGDLVAFQQPPDGTPDLRYGRIAKGKAVAYFTRKEIEEGALAGRGLEIVWLKDPADAFFMQVQGSGRVRLPDQSVLRLGFAAKSGLPYTGIGGLLVSRGVLKPEENSMQAIRAWMRKNENATRELMWENQSFVFFRVVSDLGPELGPPGAQKVPLTARRSLAVDRSLWRFGTPIWLDTEAPSGAHGAMEKFRHLMIAQDTGSAIKGHVRGDVFWGAGEAAAQIAGHMKSPGRMIVLLPRAMAEEFVTGQ